MESIFEIASSISTPLALAGFVAAVFFFILRQIIKANVIPPLTKALGGQVILTIINYVFVLALVGMVLGFIGFILPEPDTLYTVRVNVLDAQGSQVNGAEVISSIGGEKQKIQGGWQFVIPEGQVPADKQATFRAEQKNAFLRGDSTITLGSDHNPSIEITLVPDRSATISGLVVDENNNAITGALVFVVGYDAEAITTSETGGFTLAAHAADGQEVQLRAQKGGHKGMTELHPAGSLPVTLLLERE